jgi:hypothetical protein
MMTIEEAKLQAKERAKKYNPKTDNMTLRDYFAAKAINRIGKDTSYEDLAKHAYAIADAMLKARGEK